MSTVNPIGCPMCGSSDLEEITWNRRKCNNCGTESLLSDDRVTLEIIGFQCPACGFNNARSVTFCAKCGAALVKVCAKCLSQVGIEHQFCSDCGGECATERNQLLDSLRQGMAWGEKHEHALRYIETALRLHPADKELRCLRGQVHLSQSQWRQAVSDWGIVYEADPQYVPVRDLLRGFIDENMYLLTTPGLVDDRVKDEHSMRRLRTIQAEAPAALLSYRPPKPPRPPGRTSVNLLRRAWPDMAIRMEEMHQERLDALELQAQRSQEAYQVKEAEHDQQCQRYEQDRAETLEDLLTLASLCVEAREEEARRERIEAERRRQQEEQARLKREQAQAWKEASRLKPEAARQAKAPEEQSGKQVVYVIQEPPEKKKKGCCLLPIVVLVLVPISAAGLFLWLV